MFIPNQGADYIAPTVKFFVVAPRQIICGSGDVSGGESEDISYDGEL